MILAGVIVLYNPIIEELKENILSYIDSLNILYCIDNSDKKNLDIGKILSMMSNKIKYICCNCNIGLSKALIQGCKLARKENYKYILLLDQDSFFASGAVEVMKNYIAQMGCGLYSPCIKSIYRDKKGMRIFSDEIYCGDRNIEEKVSNIRYAITSGSIINLEIYQELGGFDERLFISQIDNDYCFRIHEHGYRMIRINSSYMYQESGNMKIIKLWRKKLHVPNLSPERYYYIFRNERYLRKKNGKKYFYYKVKLSKYLISIILFEKRKIMKLFFCVKGFLKKLD